MRDDYGNQFINKINIMRKYIIEYYKMLTRKDNNGVDILDLIWLNTFIVLVSAGIFALSCAIYNDYIK